MRGTSDWSVPVARHTLPTSVPRACGLAVRPWRRSSLTNRQIRLGISPSALLRKISQTCPKKALAAQYCSTATLIRRDRSMNLRLTMGLGAVALSLGLFVASSADAVTGDALLFGEYSATSTGSCLTAPSGFNDKLQPNMPEVSTVATDTGEEVWIFDGSRSVAVTSTSIRTSGV